MILLLLDTAAIVRAADSQYAGPYTCSHMAAQLQHLRGINPVSALEMEGLKALI